MTARVHSNGGKRFASAIAVLFRRKYTALSFLAVVVAGSVVFLFFTPDEYPSEMKLIVNKPVSLEGSEGAQTAGALRARVNSEVELLTSTDVLRRIVADLRLDAREASWDPEPGRRSMVLFEKAVARLQRSLRVAAIEKSNVIRVEYSAMTPQLAVAVLRRLGDVFLEMHSRLRGLEGVHGLMDSRKADYEKELSARESQLSDLRRRRAEPMLAEQRDGMLQAYLQILLQLHETEATVSQYEGKLSNLTQQRRGGALEADIAKCELELSGLRARRETLRRQLKNEKLRLSELGEAIGRHEAVIRRIREAEESYLLYARKAEEVRFQESLDRRQVGTVRIVESPVAPISPVRPSHALYLAIGLLAGSASGVAAAFAVEHLSRAVHTPAELEDVTGLKVLATIPAGDLFYTRTAEAGDLTR